MALTLGCLANHNGDSSALDDFLFQLLIQRSYLRVSDLRLVVRAELYGEQGFLLE